MVLEIPSFSNTTLSLEYAQIKDKVLRIGYEDHVSPPPRVILQKNGTELTIFYDGTWPKDPIQMVKKEFSLDDITRITDRQLLHIQDVFAAGFWLGELEAKRAPSGLYFNTFAALHGFAQLALPHTPLSPGYFTQYFAENRDRLPSYALLRPHEVEAYQEKLAEVGFIQKIGSGFTMPIPIAYVLAKQAGHIKGSDLEESAIRGIFDFAFTKKR